MRLIFFEDVHGHFLRSPAFVSEIHKQVDASTDTFLDVFTDTFRDSLVETLIFFEALFAVNGHIFHKGNKTMTVFRY